MTVDELRRFVLTLDEASESSHQGRPDFRYRNRIVVNLDEHTCEITIKLPLDDQAALIERGDNVCSLPGGWAKHGWTTIALDVRRRCEPCVDALSSLCSAEAATHSA